MHHQKPKKKTTYPLLLVSVIETERERLRERARERADSALLCEVKMVNVTTLEAQSLLTSNLLTKQ